MISPSLNSFRALAPLARIPHERGPYSVALPTTDHIVLVFGQKLGAPAAAFSHPNLLAKAPEVHWFKRYFRNGRKRWFCAAGYDLYFAVPTERIHLVFEAGYSYVPTTINGVKVLLNVSGGSSPEVAGGWRDWVRSFAHSSVGHSLRDLAKIADAAVPAAELAAAGWTWAPAKIDQGSSDPRTFQRCEAQHKVRKLLKPSMVIVVSENANRYAGCTLPVTSYCNSPYSLIVDNRLAVGPTLVDWVKTAALHDVRLTPEVDVRGVSFKAPEAMAVAV